MGSAEWKVTVKAKMKQLLKLKHGTRTIMFALLLTMLAWIVPVNARAVKARRSELWEKYDRLVQEYRTENWGIYDDSGDME